MNQPQAGQSWCELRAGPGWRQWYCKLCSAYIDDNHLSTYKHQSRYTYHMEEIMEPHPAPPAPMPAAHQPPPPPPPPLAAPMPPAHQPPPPTTTTAMATELTELNAKLSIVVEALAATDAKLAVVAGQLAETNAKLAAWGQTPPPTTAPATMAPAATAEPRPSHPLSSATPMMTPPGLATMAPAATSNTAPPDPATGSVTSAGSSKSDESYTHCVQYP